ncbi:hypothetical protein DKM44_14180 [Deinococcus irradiatisoli]|uniref:Uncharacterized protein n=1 Tax=Deinococcus irradiatisoli TaxID=2202254 RepID=A0A2Z3JUM1_9DEIO|nr:hypothetical protein [Deinococcus irradiatisoli]AWN24234.1 hypothetical protein DKM44_14180 [Deinococcus irradiatisoli]
MSSDPKSQPHPTDSPSPQGGSKDTDNLHDIKQVQNEGMAEKADQVSKLPDSVTGADAGTRTPRR